MAETKVRNGSSFRLLFEFVDRRLCGAGCVFRYHEIFFMIDTCQAASLYEKFYSPNILAMASSLVGEDSLSVSFSRIFN